MHRVPNFARPTYLSRELIEEIDSIFDRIEELDEERGGLRNSIALDQNLHETESLESRLHTLTA